MSNYTFIDEPWFVFWSFDIAGVAQACWDLQPCHAWRKCNRLHAPRRVARPPAETASVEIEPKLGCRWCQLVLIAPISSQKIKECKLQSGSYSTIEKLEYENFFQQKINPSLWTNPYIQTIVRWKRQKPKAKSLNLSERSSCNLEQFKEWKGGF